MRMVIIVLAMAAVAKASIIDDFDSYATGPLTQVSDGVWRLWENVGLDTDVVTGGLSTPNAMEHVGGPSGGPVPHVITYSSTSLLSGAGAVATFSFDFYVHDEGPFDMLGTAIWVGSGNPDANDADFGSGVCALYVDAYDEGNVGFTTLHMWDLGGELGGGDWGWIQVADGLGIDQWHHVELVATQTVDDLMANDPLDADGTFDVYVNGTPVASDLGFGFNDLNNPYGLNTLGFTSHEGRDGIHDDYHLFDNIWLVPEPAPFCLLALGALAAMRCR